MSVEPLQEDAKIEDDSSPSNPEDANALDSSSEESDAEDAISTFDIIQEAIESDSEEDAGVEDPDQETISEAEEDQPQETEEDTPEETVNTEEEDENIEDDLPTEFHEHPRFKELIAQKKDMKERIAELEATASNAEGKANLYDAIGEDNMNLYVDFLQAMDQDPREALRLIKPTIDRLVSEAGLAMSATLKQKVDDGEMTEDEAKERMALEAENASLKRKHERDNESHAQRLQQEEKAVFIDAALNWQKIKKGKDPDYSKIEKLFADHITLAVQREGRPSLDQIPAFLEKVYGNLKSQIGLATQKPAVAKKSVRSTPTPKGQEERSYVGTFDIIKSIIGQ